jgi:hypothetical protein
LPSLAIIEAQKKNKNKDFEKVKKIMLKKYEKLYQLKLYSVSNISRDGVKSAGSTRVYFLLFSLLLLLVVTINFFKNLLNFPFFFTHKKVYF